MEGVTQFESYLSENGYTHKHGNTGPINRENLSRMWENDSNGLVIMIGLYVGMSDVSEETRTRHEVETVGVTFPQVRDAEGQHVKSLPETEEGHALLLAMIEA